MTVPIECRNADLMDLAAILRQQQAVKVDVVAPATTISSQGANIIVDGGDAAGVYRPTAICDEGIADKLGVPIGYLRRLRTERPDLYDANVNGWLGGGAWHTFDGIGAAEVDPRSFLVRTFRGGDDETGVARAFLSDRFKTMDNLDVLTAALEGVRASGTAVEIEGCDLTERRMAIRVLAPEVQALAPALLANYRSPFEQGVNRSGWNLERGRAAAAREGLGYGDGGEPIVFAGFVIGNSETGGGAFTITPRIVVRVCRNGLTINIDALRSIHLGGKLDEGVVRWSTDTQERNLELVMAQARDAVTTFLDVDYVKTKVAEIEALAGAPVTKPEATVKIVAKRLGLTEDRTDEVLAHFIMGGSLTAGGIMQAITSVAQCVDDADESAELEGMALRALELAAIG